MCAVNNIYSVEVRRKNLSTLQRVWSITIVKSLQQLENSLKEFGEKWMLNPGDGAFYGPKVRHNSRATYASNTATLIMSQKQQPH